ncbi:MAG: ATP-binding protein [Coriobacteriia bacterium]|nr:ATP-binding protein [Coriobacteriia bacterium]
MVNRPYYLDWLSRWQDKDMVKVLTGLRRSGKSTIMRMFQEQLQATGISDANIISINFESLDEDYPLRHKELYRYIVDRLAPTGTNYVFLDEVQHVDEFERAVNALHVRQDIDLYITGSNAYFLSGELATFLTGRYVEIMVFPYSFKEYSMAVEEADFDRYLTYGGLPYAATLTGEQEVMDYLASVFGTIILEDIAKRRPKMDMNAFMATASFLADNVGNVSSIKRISDGLSEQGSRVSQGAVREYLEALIENFLLYKVQRFDLKGKEYLKTLEKYYLGDLGFRFWLLGKRAGDVGHRLENIVYLELRRRYSRVAIGKQETQEIDFVAMNERGPSYFQVSQTIADEKTLARELRSLQRLDDNYPKVLLTLDTVGIGNFEGVEHMNLIDWLLE